MVTKSRMTHGLWAPALATLACLPMTATGQASDSIPVVVVQGTGRIELEPNYAEISLGVEAQDDSPAETADIMSRQLQAVADTLAALGFPPDSFPRSAFAVRPRYDFERDREMVGFSAVVSLTLRTTDLDLVSDLIAAALATGATSVDNVRFLSTEANAARLEALRLAFDQARDEAEALAAASGHGLGAVQSISTQRQQGFDLPALRLEQVVVTGLAVQPQKVMVEASVTVRWRLGS